MKRILITLTTVATLATGAQGASVLDGTFDESAAGVSFEVMHRAMAADFLDPDSAQYKKS